MNIIYDEYTDRTDLTYGQKHYLRNKERSNNRTRQYVMGRKFKDPSGYLCTRIRNRAAEKGVDFDLEPEDFVIPERCPISDIPLFFSDNKRTDNTPSVDRIDNDKGYIKGNIAIISWRANKLKSDSSQEEIARLHEYLKTPYH